MAIPIKKQFLLIPHSRILNQSLLHFNFLFYLCLILLFFHVGQLVFKMVVDVLVCDCGTDCFEALFQAFLGDFGLGELFFAVDVFNGFHQFPSVSRCSFTKCTKMDGCFLTSFRFHFIQGQLTKLQFDLFLHRWGCNIMFLCRFFLIFDFYCILHNLDYKYIK